MDSSLFPTVDWPTLRVWADSTGAGRIYCGSVEGPCDGDRRAAIRRLRQSSRLQGTATAGDYVEVAWLTEHYHLSVRIGTDTLAALYKRSPMRLTRMLPTVDLRRCSASVVERSSRLTYLGTTATARGRQRTDSVTGANGNRIGAYANVTGAATESWSPAWQYFSGGTSPTMECRTATSASERLGNHDPTKTMVHVPTTAVRKLRWTYAADFQIGAYERSEFQVTISNWSVTGTGLGTRLPGARAAAIEDDSPDLSYSGSWSLTVPPGNFSGGIAAFHNHAPTHRFATRTRPRRLTAFIWGRGRLSGAQITITVDGVAAARQRISLYSGEDVLVRILLGNLAGGVAHTVTVTHTGTAGSYFFFDFFEIAVPTENLPVIASDSESDAGDGLGYDSFACPPAGAHGVAYQDSGFHRTREPLCGRALVLRTGTARTSVTLQER